MAACNRADWLIPSGLIALAFIPVVAGAVRLSVVAGGGLPTTANARCFDAPMPVVLHIISVTVYSLLGAFQFAPDLRRKRPEWHSAAGCVLFLAGLVVALSIVLGKLAIRRRVVAAQAVATRGLRASS